MAMLRIPDGHDDSVFVASVSGGKDSTAMMLALREAGIPFRAVFADTGWEAPDTYRYLDQLRSLLSVEIDVVRSKLGGMLDIADKKAGFPTRRGRWCTEKLKIIPLREYHDVIRATGAETVSVVGVRADESEARAQMKEFELAPDPPDGWGGYVWRPLKHWTLDEVLAIHHRHGIPVNPLYRKGFNRVGCNPCIFATKADVRLTAEHFPERIVQIRQKEAEYTVERGLRNTNGTGDFKHPSATFFMSKESDGRITPIDDVVKWARTDRGGRQLPLLPETPDSGCFAWGLCDPPEPVKK